MSFTPNYEEPCEIKCTCSFCKISENPHIVGLAYYLQEYVWIIFFREYNKHKIFPDFFNYRGLYFVKHDKFNWRIWPIDARKAEDCLTSLPSNLTKDLLWRLNQL